MKGVAAVVLTLQSMFLFGQADLQAVYTKALEAHTRGDEKAYYTFINEALQIHPYHEGIRYQAAMAAALNNKKDEAVSHLKVALLVRSDFSLAVSELNSLRGYPPFEALKTLQEQVSKVIIHSDTLVALDDKTLHIESITPGESPDIFYLASIHRRKVLQLKNGKLSDVPGLDKTTLGAVFDVKMDPDNRHLWVCTSSMPEMEEPERKLPGQVLKYDTRGQKVVATFLPMKTHEEPVFGSLAVDPKGNVYVSDSKNNLVFLVDEKAGRLIQYFSSDQFWNIQGIAFSPEGKYLFVADYVKGIFRVDRKNFDVLLLPGKFDRSFKSVDGLIFYNNSLIAFQNATKPMRVMQYTLNKSMDAFTGYKTIDQAHPAFHEPTQGTRVGDTLYYVSGSYWAGYDSNGTLKPIDELKPAVILTVKLDTVR